MFPSIDMLWIFLAGLVCCSVGFYQFVWFMSVGYGLSAAGIGLTALILSIVRGQFSVPYTLLCIMLIVYGFRLGGFLLIRQLKNAGYRNKMKELGADAKVPVFVGFFMWIIFAALYFMQTSGPIYRLVNKAEDNVFLWIGIVICAAGILIEAIADKQKSAAKKLNPAMPAMHGLYKMCRCPNYFGEMLFWTGVVVSSIGAVTGAQWIFVGVGYVAIIYIMLSGAKRVEGRHIRNYGDKPEYNKYADSTPLIFPLIPLYHMTSPEKMAKEEAAKKAKAEKKAKK